MNPIKMQKRIEILDWYHLMENLHKTEASKNQIEQLKADLWMGQMTTAINYLNQEQPIRGHQFSNYLKKHASRIVNYHYLRLYNVINLICYFWDSFSIVT